MTYSFLEEPLRPVADEVAKYFRVHYGASKIESETALDFYDEFAPTLKGNLQDHCSLCVEVTSTGIRPTFLNFILECVRKCHPVKAYLAIPSSAGNIERHLKSAEEHGLGLIEVNETTIREVKQPLVLGLTGAREPAYLSFPRKRRARLHDAWNAYRNGDPNGGCAIIYQEMENLTRKFASRSYRSKGWWSEKPTKASGKRVKINFENEPWARVLGYLVKYIDLPKKKCPKLKISLLQKLQGAPDPRNESHHVPATQKALITRNQKLKTRFEEFGDMYLELCEALKPLRL